MRLKRCEQAALTRRRLRPALQLEVNLAGDRDSQFSDNPANRNPSKK